MPKMKLIAIRIPLRDLAALRKIAKRRRTTLSDVIRGLLAA